MPSAHSRKLAIFLSAVLPGLGQFYNRQWAKGAGFLVATLVVDAAFGVTLETIAVFQSAFLGMPGTNVNIGGLGLRMLPLAAIATWSMTDAAWTAKRRLG
jgi:hypothetical protein